MEQCGERINRAQPKNQTGGKHSKEINYDRIICATNESFVIDCGYGGFIDAVVPTHIFRLLKFCKLAQSCKMSSEKPQNIAEGLLCVVLSSHQLLLVSGCLTAGMKG